MGMWKINCKGFVLSCRWVGETNEIARLWKSNYFSYMDGIDKFKTEDLIFEIVTTIV